MESWSETLRDGVGLGVYWSLFASVMIIPAGVVLGSWQLPALTYAVIMVVCIVSHAIVERGSDGVLTAAGVLVWLLAVAGGVALVAFGVHAVITFTPSCVPSERVQCRIVYNGRDIGEATGPDTLADNLTLFYPIVAGIVVLVVATVFAVNFVKDRRKRW